MKSRLLAIALASAALPVFAGGAADDIATSEVRVRAVPEGQKNSAAFMVLANGSTVDHAVVSAQSPAADVVELHTHVNDNGMMKMRRIERIDIPANGQTVLEPGGLHVMLLGLTTSLADGDEIPVTLVLEDNSLLELTAPVKKLQMMMQAHQHNNQHGGTSTSD
ncbi:MAG: copper chaperone PCu(A)C [Proteobacteria bacterium]|nr:MAG: copper chaperone PCu(A)C [Pseudomonadota bacterium]